MANFEELTSEERFLKFKEELKLLSEKFRNSEDLKMAKFSLIVFEDINYLADKFFGVDQVPFENIEALTIESFGGSSKTLSVYSTQTATAFPLASTTTSGISL